MTVILKIPIKENIESKSKTKKLKMEIIHNKRFNRANIKFIEGKPSKELCTIFKKEGWFYSTKLGIWYPQGIEAAKNSYKFANKIKEQFCTD
ncbi:hypothetical protein J5751_03265 [bacterium]|nr:hypothetical protein [bacterium]